MTFEILKNHFIRKIKIEPIPLEKRRDDREGIWACDYCEKKPVWLFWIDGWYYGPDYYGLCGVLCSKCLRIFKKEQKELEK